MQNEELTQLYAKADRYKAKIDSARPLTEREAKNLDDYFKIGLTFSSNAIEGNTLTITETKVLLEDGLAVQYSDDHRNQGAAGGRSHRRRKTHPRLLRGDRSRQGIRLYAYAGERP